jgi:hypothetical protein
MTAYVLPSGDGLMLNSIRRFAFFVTYISTISGDVKPISRKEASRILRENRTGTERYKNVTFKVRKSAPVIL